MYICLGCCLSAGDQFSGQFFQNHLSHHEKGGYEYRITIRIIYLNPEIEPRPRIFRARPVRTRTDRLVQPAKISDILGENFSWLAQNSGPTGSKFSQPGPDSARRARIWARAGSISLA